MVLSPSKKRKRDADADDKLSFKLSNQPASQLGPVLASFPVLKPSASTPFECYLLKKTEKEYDLTADFVAQPTFIAGEADTVEFFTSYDETRKVAAGGCRYFVGVHNKKTKTTILRPAPLHVLSRRVKALKGLENPEASALQWQEARAALGETFGTKKAKASIRAQERNKVDVAAMESVAEHLQERIELNTGSLPTQDEAKEEADNSRPIPPCNVHAQEPADVYPLFDIIPEAEWNALSISALIDAQDHREVRALLPHRRSNWVNQHITSVLKAETARTQNLKILYYISAMYAFRWASKGAIERSKLQEKLVGVPSVVIDGLLARFTETSRGSMTPQTTTRTQTSVLTHIFALSLHVDNYATDPVVIASDLAMPLKSVHTLFRSLGCKIVKLADNELRRLGLPDSAGETKRAVLMAPPEFPKARKRKERR